jgi:hypothetical protein
MSSRSSVPPPSEIPITSQIIAVDREIRLREKHYPRLIKKGHLTQKGADFEIARMKAVLQTLFWVQDQLE